MSELPNVEPLPTPPRQMDRPTRDDVRQVLRGLAPGWYTALALLPRYNTWARNEGRGEITAKALGEVLCQFVNRRRSRGNVSAYEVTTELSLGEA